MKRSDKPRWRPCPRVAASSASLTAAWPIAASVKIRWRKRKAMPPRRGTLSDEARYGKMHGFVALDQSRLARASRLTNLDAEAEKLCHQALKTSEAELGIFRSDVREIFNEIVLLQKQNKVDAVTQLEAKATALHLPASRTIVK